jgi:cytochrome c-type biogenesis protein CcmF
MLFLGYALLAAPYAITIGALVDRDAEGWPKAVWPWVLVAWLALTLGNGFGAEWAYKTFGWGGFWSWDPVENTSFVPWMLVAAGIHCLWMAKRSGAWLRPAAVCIAGAFVAVLYGSYLARSGALAGASVHAYVAGEKLMQYALGGLLVGATVLVAAVLIPRWKEWKTAAEGKGDDPVAGATSQGIAAMMAVAVLVLGGMSLPMLGTAPTTTAYNTAVMPLALVMMVMLLRTGGWALSGAMRWVARVVVALWLIAAWGMALMYGSMTDHGAGMMIQALCGPPLLLTACLVALQSVGQILGGTVSWRRIGPPLAHLGFAALLIGALGSGFGTATEKAYLGLGEEQQVLGHSLQATDVSVPAPEVKRANLTMDDAPGRVEMETSKLFDVSLRRALIRRELARDVYVTPIAIVVEPMRMGPHTIPPGAMVEVAVKPGMSLVWLGMLGIAAGLVSALGRRSRRAATTAE